MKNKLSINPIFPLVVLSLFLLVTMLFGCSNNIPTTPSTEPTTEPTTAPTAEPTVMPDNAWAMTAALVDSSGQVLETSELTARVMIWEQEGRDYYSLGFRYPDGIYNSTSGVMPYPEDETAYTCCSGFRTESGGQGDVTGSYYVAFDPEKECFIVDFDDGEDLYLIAYRSPDADISALWDHFQDFFTMMPDAFPQIAG